MPNPHWTLLRDRNVVSVTGGDAGKLLQDLITNDVALLAIQPAIFAALLSPQGKILFDFLIVKGEGGYLLDTAGGQGAGLAKRIQLYKLRADVAIEDVSADYVVGVSSGGPGTAAAPGTNGIAYPDPRLAELGARAIIPRASAGDLDDQAEAYHTRRIALGVPEGGKDYTLGDTFSHEALLDQLNGVSFTKGCFVGQEVVSRMEHRGTARKRVVPVIGTEPLPAGGGEITAGEAAIGSLGSVSGVRGLALLRLDRAGEAIAKGVPLHAAGVPIEIELPSFATFTLQARSEPAH